MGEKKKSLLEQRIEQFCSTSGELLADIQARYNGKDSSKSKGRKKSKQLISIEDLKADFMDIDDEPLEEI